MMMRHLRSWIQRHSRRRAVNRQSISLFWRTFLWLTLLLMGSMLAWIQTFKTLETAPRAIQSATQLASLVNLTRAALLHADPIARVSLVKTLVDEENVRIAVREPSDTYKAYPSDNLGRHLKAALTDRLGPSTIVARQVNGFDGLWVGFKMGDESFWLLVDPERIGAIDSTTWLVWLAIAGGLSMVGAALITRFINRPLKQLSFATARVREGDFQASHLDEDVATDEIRHVNIGFNRMAERLRKAEVDRTLMLAGISHDLRTPLARLRLETEMSVADATARELMAADIEQVNTIIDKFLDYARADQARLEVVNLREVLDLSSQPLIPSGQLALNVSMATSIEVKADPVELRRVFNNLLENAIRYGKNKEGMAVVEITGAVQGNSVTVQVRDHGPGVKPEQIGRLTEPFYRSDEARTAASGSGLGLAIVSKTVSRMGGELKLSNHTEGGLVATMKLQKA